MHGVVWRQVWGLTLLVNERGQLDGGVGDPVRDDVAYAETGEADCRPRSRRAAPHQ